MVNYKYDSIRPYLKTGDIVLFSGKGLFSNVIKLVTNCKWSHVGIVLKFKDEDFVALWESTTLSNVNDIPTRKAKKGVQLVPLSKRIDLYKGRVAIRQLQKSIPDASIRLTNLRNKLKNKRYERSYAELFKSAYDGIFTKLFSKNTTDISSVFCSELVAEAYIELGLLPRVIPSNEYTPADFADVFKLDNNNSLSELVIIKE